MKIVLLILMGISVLVFVYNFVMLCESIHPVFTKKDRETTDSEDNLGDAIYEIKNQKHGKKL